jgi:hypothetical protein
MLDDSHFISEGEALLAKIEKSIRDLKAEYTKTLSDFQGLKSGDAEIFEGVESDYLSLLSRIQKSIRTTSELWDRTITKIEKMKERKKLRDESFLTGVLWSLDQADVSQERKSEIIASARKLISHKVD